MSLTTLAPPSLDEQVSRLIGLGVLERAGLPEAWLRSAVAEAPSSGDALVVISPTVIPPSHLAPLLRHQGKPGFVVNDMEDVDRFTAIADLQLPGAPAYLVHGPQRGDDMSNWSPNEALPEIVSRGRTPLTLAEGIHWLLQAPDVLERNHCFMTIGSRLLKKNGALDARTPAIWISRGTGRDGTARRNAPKVGWCWAGNRHTWLGFASAAGRSTLP